MTDWGKSGRFDRFEFSLCDPFTLEEVGKLDADASASSLTWGYYTDNLYSGTIALVGSGDLPKDRLVRVRHVVEADGAVDSRNLATMFVKDAPATERYGRRETRAECYSTLFRFTQDELAGDFARPEGYNAVQAVRELVEEVGGKLRVLDGTDTERTFGNDVWLGLGTNRMTALSTVAGWIGAQMGCDADGYATIGPYTTPGDKPVRYRFEEGANCAYLPGVDEEDNRADAVNRVVAYYTRESADDGYPLTGRAVAELGDESALSFARCGRYQTHVIKLDDPCSADELESKARTYLAENSGGIRYATIEHVSIPGLTVGDVVEYENGSDYPEPTLARCMVVQMDMRSLTPGAVCTTKLKVIDR